MIATISSKDGTPLPLLGGIPLWWPSSSSWRSPWRGGSSSPLGLRVCTSSYVFDLSLSVSLSLPCSWFGTILMYRELFYYIWILWCFLPLYLSCNGLSFPFEVILLDWVFKDLRTLDVSLACAYLWWQWEITWSTWCMFWWSTCEFCDLVNLCIGVGTLR